MKPLISGLVVAAPVSYSESALVLTWGGLYLLVFTPIDAP